MATLLAVLNAVKAFEESLSIEAPVRITEPRAYLTVPDRKHPLGTTTAAFENIVEQGMTEMRMGSNREDNFTVRVRGTFYDANLDVACEIALAFYDAAWRAFDSERPSSRRFDGLVDYLNIRGSETQIPANYDGRVGWEMFLDITSFEESDV